MISWYQGYGLWVRFLRPLGGQKPMAVKTVPQKLPPLYKAFDRFTGPNKQTLVGKVISNYWGTSAYDKECHNASLQKNIWTFIQKYD